MGQQQEACTVKIFTCSLCKRCWRQIVVVCVSCRQMDGPAQFVCMSVSVHKDLAFLSAYQN